jgi:hypothetical protein
MPGNESASECGVRFGRTLALRQQFRDLIGCFAEQSLIVGQPVGAGDGSGLEDLDLLLQELAPGDDPEWQACTPTSISR